MSETADAAERPSWFDEDKHVHSSDGIADRATGALLAADGYPKAGPLRVEALAAAGLRTDELGRVSDAAIAAAAARLAVDQAADAPSTVEPAAGTQSEEQ